ncbi:MAG: response regulator [Rubritalea sp.]|uniref:response regulator n=1 Tax=Rubritalea sp. TaxID=2109375 RepID=UPI003241F91B
MAKILIAEDSPHFVKLVELILKRDGHSARFAVDGEKALHEVRENLPDVAILDVNMPGMDGLEVLEAIKSDPETSGVPVIILTASSHALTEQEAIASGAAAFLTKPFSPISLLSTINKITSKTL